MRENGKKVSKVELVKKLAKARHPSIYTIVQGNVGRSSDLAEYAVITDEGVFFNKLADEVLIPLFQLSWQEVHSGTVDFFALHTLFTLNDQQFRLTNEGKSVHEYAQQRTGIDIPVIERLWYQKLFGYRSATPWKQTTAFFIYLVLAAFIFSLFPQFTFVGLLSFISVVIAIVAVIALFKGKWERLKIPNRRMAASLLVASMILIGILPASEIESEEALEVETAESADALEADQEATEEEKKKTSEVAEETEEENNKEPKEEEIASIEKETQEQKEKEAEEQVQAEKEAEAIAKKKTEEKKEKEEAQVKQEAEEEKKKQEAAPNATVTRVMDGDTIEVTMNGEIKEIRLLLVDTPETKHPQKPVEPFGPEATAFVENKLLGQEVRVKVGSEEKDKYGRTLAYVFLGEETIQEMLLEEGLATTAYLYNDLTMLEDFHAAQQIAIDAGIGVWSIPGYAQVDQENGFQYEEPAPEPEPEPKAEPAPEPKEEKVETPAPETEVYYKNCDAARAAGAAPVHRGEPGYAKHLDRDNDGVGCE